MGKRLRSKAFIRKSKMFLRFFFKLSIFILITLSVRAFLQRSNFFHVKEVTILGTKLFVSKRDLQNVLNSSIVKRNILNVDIAKLKTSILANFQGAKDVNIKKNYPNKIVVTVKERTPIALLQSNKTNDTFIIDDDGYVLGTVANETSNLPKISYEGDVKVGYFVDKKFAPVYLELINSIDKEKLQVSSISMDEKNITLYTDDSIEVILEKAKDIGNNIRVLSSLLKQLKAEGKNAKKVDLRYDKVIVSYR